jgi:hypothetical protein
MLIPRPLDYWRLNASGPLSWPPEEAPTVIAFEQKCESIPVVGRLIARQMERHRMRRVVRHFHAQVQRRPPIDPEMSGDDLARRQFAAFLADAIRDASSWPNDHFVPADPISILCCVHDPSGMEFILLHFAVEKWIGTQIPHEQFYRIIDMSFAEAVDFLRTLAVCHS